MNIPSTSDIYVLEVGSNQFSKLTESNIFTNNLNITESSSTVLV